MTQNQNQLAGYLGKLIAEIESQFGTEVEGWQENIDAGIATRKKTLHGQKATPADFVDTGLELAKAIAQETGNEKAIEIVDDLANTAEDGLHGKYLALFADLLKDFQAIKKAAKK